MRVAIVLNTSWNIYNFRKGLVKALMQKGFEVFAIAPEDQFSHKLVELGCQYEKVTMDSRGANPVKDFGLTLELFQIYKRIKPDIILHFTIKPNIYGTLAARVLNIPVINNVCGLGTVFLNENLVSKIAFTMYKFTFRFPKKVFFQNSQDQQLFIDRSLVNSVQTEVIPGSGIRLDQFTPNVGKENVTDNIFTFLLISRLLIDKGIIEYVKAVEELRNMGIQAKFQILGAIDTEHKRGISQEKVKSWVDNNIIEYLGTTEDVRPYIQNADCVVLPSYREGTPRTLLEAASSAKPIVATDVAGCNNVVEDNFNGLLCKVQDHTDLAKKMEMMFSLPQEARIKMGKNGRKKMEKEFSEDIVIGSYLKCIQEIKFVMN
ncbi:glycosyltransferase family 1 protein [Cytophagales bacterium RKSG123]|nr:glycosyltransferase family 1 protein [Xanthovirga aplysinae]